MIYARLLDLLDESGAYFSRMLRIRKNTEWAPDRPIRAELKLARVNAKVDRVEHQLLEALKMELRGDVGQPRDPLAPRSPAYLIPFLDEEANRLEAEAEQTS